MIAGRTVLATAMFAFAALVVVARLIPPLRRYFEQGYDVVSMLTIPIVPNLVYAALLIAVGVALRRRLRAAWWVLVIWLIIIPQLARIYSIITGGPLLQIAGLVIMTAVLVIVWRAKSQFLARGVLRNLVAAIICFLLGGVVILVFGTWLISTFGTAPDLPTAALHVVDKLLGDVGLTRPDEVLVSHLGHDLGGRHGCGNHPHLHVLALQATGGHPNARRR